MRASLRRSCDGCAKAKHACDLQTPRCSRCVKRQVNCVYANQPLTSSASASTSASVSPDLSRHPSEPATSPALTSSTATAGSLSPGGSRSPEEDALLVVASSHQGTPAALNEGDLMLLPKSANASLDPFDSYPPTRLPRTHAQRLIYHFLSNIAFQYYPLDMDMASNPFVVSWWPRALADPALFHVSLQTASLDEELRAQKGFSTSELLMMDSVSLVRQRIGDATLAFQDETLNSVVTLAAIEHGKGNHTASNMHIDGIKEMVTVRGGIAEVKRSSPLTARMISWVSMIVTCAPQFSVEESDGSGIGISPIPQWQTATDEPAEPLVHGIDIDPTIRDILARLRQTLRHNLTGTELHDLTCFVLHKLLLLPRVTALDTTTTTSIAVSECLRYALSLFMLLMHGTTYYSHHNLANLLLRQLKSNFQQFAGTTAYAFSAVGIWILTVGMAASSGTAAAAWTTDSHQWFVDQAYVAKSALGIRRWDDVLARLESIVWVNDSAPGEDIFRLGWEEIL